LWVIRVQTLLLLRSPVEKLRTLRILEAFVSQMIADFDDDAQWQLVASNQRTFAAFAEKLLWLP